MTNNQLTDDRIAALLDCVEMCEDMSVDENAEMATALRELQERRKAAMGREPVGWTDEEELRDVERGGCGYLFTVNPVTPHADERRIILLYRHAQPAPKTEREPIAWLNDAYLARGVVDGEAGSEDAGPGYIPVYREASPAQPAPVVQENSDPRDAFEAVFPMPKHAQRCGDGYAVTSYGAWTAYEFVKKWEGWNACRSAMLQESQKSAGASNNCRSGENVQDLQAGNSPVIPDAARDALEKALAAMEFMGDTLNNLDAVCSEDVEFVTPAFDAVRRVLEATPQEVQGE